MQTGYVQMGATARGAPHGAPRPGPRAAEGASADGRADQAISTEHMGLGTCHIERRDDTFSIKAGN